LTWFDAPAKIDRIDKLRYPPDEAGGAVNTWIELVALVQRDRERQIERDGLVRIARWVRDCCSTSARSRLARALHLAPAC
jgi:hypothetical protein